MNSRKIILCICLGFFATSLSAQDSFEAFRAKQKQEFGLFKKKAEEEYQALRDKMNKEYSELMKKGWKSAPSMKGIEQPKIKPIKPIEYVKEQAPAPVKALPVEGKVVKIEKPKAQPKPAVPIPPIATIKEKKPALRPTAKPTKSEKLEFLYYGLPVSVEINSNLSFALKNATEKEISKTWSRLSGTEYNDLINSCIATRDKYKMCDWAYIQMLNEVATRFFKRKCNEATLLAAYLYSQSGYKMRLGRGGEKLYLLYASKHTIFSKNYWIIEGEKYYIYEGNVSSLQICNAKYANEQALSMQITDKQQFPDKFTPVQKKAANKYTGYLSNLRINKNLLDFYNTYPSAGYGNEKWSTYANTPISDEIKTALYPSLAKAIKGKSELEAVNYLLDFVQNGFTYEYDDKVWGGDRVFFPEETLYYPYSDCDDRAILFSRLVRDLVGLDVVLLYYPNHLATAVRFTTQPTGDYVTVENSNYIVCDPTYINAPAGRTMPQVANSSARIIMIN